MSSAISISTSIDAGIVAVGVFEIGTVAVADTKSSSSLNRAAASRSTVRNGVLSSSVVTGIGAVAVADTGLSLSLNRVVASSSRGTVRTGVLPGVGVVSGVTVVVRLRRGATVRHPLSLISSLLLLLLIYGRAVPVAAAAASLAAAVADAVSVVCSVPWLLY